LRIAQPKLSYPQSNSSENESFDLGFRVSKIDQQTDFVSSRLEVVKQLGFVDFLQGLYRFEFNYNLVFSHDIRKILSNFMTLL